MKVENNNDLILKKITFLIRYPDNKNLKLS